MLEIFLQAAARVKTFHAELEAGHPLDQQFAQRLRTIVGDIDEDLQEQACEEVMVLCRAEQFEDAAPIAGILSICQPDNSRYTYLAAFCQQNLGQEELALAMYGQSMLGSDPCASTLYRIGECHASLGNFEEAIQAFDASIEAAREEPDEGHRVYELAEQRKAMAQRALEQKATASA